MKMNAIRQIMYDKYGGCCAYCGCDLSLSTFSWAKFHIDHITPKIMGGSDDIGNLNPACRHCNLYKSQLDVEGYRQRLLTMLNEEQDYLFKSRTKMQVALNMGAVILIKWDGKFYFEKIMSINIVGKYYYQTTPKRQRCKTKCEYTKMYVGSVECRDVCQNHIGYGKDVNGKYVNCAAKDKRNNQ